MRHLLDRPIRLHVSASGAGAGIQEALWNVPGISKILVGAEFPYEDVGNFIGYKPENYVTLRVAADMAIESYLRAAKRCKPELSPMGLGLTASVASNREHRGEHRIHAIAISRFGAYGCSFTLNKEVGSREADGAQSDQLGLRLIELAAEDHVDRDELRSLITQYGQGDIFDALPTVRAALFGTPIFTRHGTRKTLAQLGPNVALMPGSYNPLHQGHLAGSNERTLLQITASSPHKAAASVTDLLDRVVRIREHRDVLLLEGCGLYIEKARLIPGVDLKLGADSMLRMLDPKWGIDPEPLLMEFQELATRFEVSNREGSPRFHEAILTIPEQYRYMFREAPRQSFEHYSSTAVRAGDLPGLPPNE